MIPEQNPTFDTYCEQPDCISTKNAFFVYQDENFHVKEHHPVKMIHPLQLSSIYSALAQKEKVGLEKGKAALESNVVGYINNFCRRMGDFMKRAYLNQYIDIMRAEIGKYKLNDVHEVCNRLRKGDYDMLQEIMDTENKDVSQEEKRSQSMLDGKMNSIDKIISKKLEDLYQGFEKIISVTFSNLEDFNKIASGSVEEISRDNMEEFKKLVLASTSNESSEQIPNFGKNSSRRSEIDQSFEATDKKKTSKSKKIHKAPIEKKSKPAVNISDSSSIITPSPFLVSMTVGQTISEIAPSEIRIYTCSNPQQTFEYLTSRYKTLKGIHIFHYKLATKQWLEKIFKFYGPTLRNISLNCSHDFDYKLLFSFPKETIPKIESLELKWCMGKFFVDYHILKFFPSKKKQKIENFNKINLPAKAFKELKSNQSLALCGEKMIDSLIETEGFTFENIRTLHAYKTADEKSIALTKLNRMCIFRLTNLLHLNLCQIYIGDCEWAFKELIMSNLCLTALIIEYCTIKRRSVGSLFESLQVLPNLTKLFFSWHSKTEDPCVVNPEYLFCHPHLQELYIDNVGLVESCDKEPDFTNLKQLTKLTRLSLYTCYTVKSSFMKHISDQTLANIEYLNLGYTDVNDEFMNYFPRMVKLTNLDIDQTVITGSAFAQACRQFYRVNNSYPPLKRLNLEQHKIKKTKGEVERVSIEDMKEMGRYLTSLSYLQITNCMNLSYYNFAEFKNLKMVAMDSELASKMIHLSPVVKKFVIDQQQP